MSKQAIQELSVIERAEAYAKSKNLTMFFDYDVCEMRYKILFKKYGYLTEVCIDSTMIESEEEFEQILWELIDKADELLQSCKY